MKITINNFNGHWNHSKRELNNYKSFKHIETTEHIGSKWTSITLKAKLTEKQLKRLRRITTILLIFTFGIAKCFKTFRENLRTLNTGERVIIVRTKRSNWFKDSLKKILKDRFQFKNLEIPPTQLTPTPILLERPENAPTSSLINDVWGIVLDYLDTEDRHKLLSYDPTLLPLNRTIKSFENFLKIATSKKYLTISESEKLLSLIENKIKQSKDLKEYMSNIEDIKNEILEIIYNNFRYSRELDCLDYDNLKRYNPPIEYAYLIEIAATACGITNGVIQYKNIKDDKLKNERFILAKTKQVIIHHAENALELHLNWTLEKENDYDSYKLICINKLQNILPVPLRDNLEFMSDLIKIHPYFVFLASENLKDNPNFALLALNRYGKSFREFSERLRDDDEIVLAAVRNVKFNGEQLDEIKSYASERIRKYYPELFDYPKETPPEPQGNSSRYSMA